MALLRMKNHTLNHLWLQKLLCFCFLSLFFVFNSCSSDDEKGGENVSPTAHYLGRGNSNMPSDGNVMTQYGDAPAGSEISKLVDGDAGTSYLTHHRSVEIKWIGSKSITIQSYAITSAPDSPEKDPKSWILYGSSGNGNWIELDKRKNVAFGGRKETKVYELTAEAPYSYYKLSITGNNGSNDTQIAEWKITEVPAPPIDENSIDDLMERSFNNTASVATPMGKDHLNDKQVVTQADLDWLADPTKQPNVFGGFAWSNFPIDVNGIYPYGIPKPADVNQHSVGDCSLLATIAYIAHYCPNFFKTIIKENGNNTFTVTLYDPKGEKISVGVDNLFVGDSGIGATSGKGTNRVTWATIIEKAIMKWHQIFRGTSDIGGIDTVYASAIITGNGSSFTFNPESYLTGVELQRVVKVSIREQKILVGGFRFMGEDLPIDGKYHTVSAHAYSIYLTGNSNYLFAMRNPWGNAATINNYDASKEDGVMNIPDDGLVIPTIDIRVVEAGSAAPYFVGDPGPYTPPSYSPSPMRVAENLRSSQALLRAESLRKMKR